MLCLPQPGKGTCTALQQGWSEFQLLLWIGKQLSMCLLQPHKDRQTDCRELWVPHFDIQMAEMDDSDAPTADKCSRPPAESLHDVCSACIS